MKKKKKMMTVMKKQQKKKNEKKEKEEGENEDKDGEIEVEVEVEQKEEEKIQQTRRHNKREMRCRENGFIMEYQTKYVDISHFESLLHDTFVWRRLDD